MITILNCYKGVDGVRYDFIGRSTDTKPTGKLNGSSFYEMNTGRTYRYDEEGEGWVLQGASKYPISCAVTTQPTKTSYTEGEDFDPTGMVLTVTWKAYNAEASTTTTVSGAGLAALEFKPSTALEADVTKIAVTYTDTEYSGVSVSTDITVTVSEVSEGGEG